MVGVADHHGVTEDRQVHGEVGPVPRSHLPKGQSSIRDGDCSLHGTRHARSWGQCHLRCMPIGHGGHEASRRSGTCVYPEGTLTYPVLQEQGPWPRYLGDMPVDSVSERPFRSPATDTDVAHRLMVALAEAIKERGYKNATVADVVRIAKMSRRAFY